MEILTLNDYQDRAIETAIYPRLFTESQARSSRDLRVIETPFNNLVYPALGLAGEAAEISNKVKKLARDNDGQVSPDELMQIADEIGDCLWYLAACATAIGIELEEVGSANLSKLASRKERGVIGGSGDNR